MSAAKRHKAAKRPAPRKPARAKQAARPAARPAAGKRAVAAKAAPAKRPAAARPAAPAKRPAAVAKRPVAPPRPAPPPPPPPVPVIKQSVRLQLLGKLQKALRAQYKPVAFDTSRDLLEQALVACCLENAPYDAAEKAFARLKTSAYDLNEIRVTTVAELAESLQGLPDPARAALALRRVLQSVFESTYTFSLDNAKKHSLSHGLKTLEHLHGVSPFVVHHVASTALGGHFIPLDHGALAALYLCGIVTKPEYDAGKVPGFERLVPKKVGVEFASLLHQFGVECLTNLHGATVKKILQAVNPAGKDLLPKRGEPLPAPVPPAPAAGREGQKAAEAARQSAEAHRPAGPQAAARPAGKTPLPPPGSGPKRTADGKAIGGKPGPKPFVVKPNIGKPLTIKPELAHPPAAKPAAPPKKPAKPAAPASSAARKPAKINPRGTIAAKKAGSAGKSHARQLAKRKPR